MEHPVVAAAAGELGARPRRRRVGVRVRLPRRRERVHHAARHAGPGATLGRRRGLRPPARGREGLESAQVELHSPCDSWGPVVASVQQWRLASAVLVARFLKAVLGPWRLAVFSPRHYPPRAQPKPRQALRAPDDINLPTPELVRSLVQDIRGGHGRVVGGGRGVAAVSAVGGAEPKLAGICWRLRLALGPAAAALRPRRRRGRAGGLGLCSQQRRRRHRGWRRQLRGVGSCRNQL
mmetsp:Transcript_108168/g.345457  ORF Transcript_108168/g.345457 Transcript_108168/m.345457 type:complete len:236 (+) Transcript_108168:163-870(+)